MSTMVLKIDYEAAYKELVDIILVLSSELINEFHSESTSGMTGDVDLEDARIMGDMITSKVTFYADAIMQSFGTGSLMDRSNPYLSEYINSGKWNPARYNYAIVGRPEGEYENIYGETGYSSGRMEGINIESFIKPISPTYGIQKAEQWLLKEDGKIRRRLNTEMNIFVSGMSKYFYNAFV